MQLLTTIEKLRCWSREQHKAGKTIGLVPTMGALHTGHLSLVQAANERCDAAVVSIFVNPTQFAPNEDFQHYPRPLENDLQLLEAEGSPAVFVPAVEEMYPAGFDAAVHIGGVSQPLEGKSRPTHFSGVVTVVMKLFLASEAETAFFGQKDYQQVCVVKKMVADLNVPIEIAVCPIVREPDGLAMSSRNRYLSDKHRQQAVTLSKSLTQAETLLSQGKRNVETIRRAVTQTILDDTEFIIDYVSIVHPFTLQELTDEELTALETSPTPHAAVLLAAKLGTTRLIDNALIPLALHRVKNTL